MTHLPGPLRRMYWMAGIQVRQEEIQIRGRLAVFGEIQQHVSTDLLVAIAGGGAHRRRDPRSA